MSIVTLQRITSRPKVYKCYPYCSDLLDVGVRGPEGGETEELGELGHHGIREHRYVAQQLVHAVPGTRARSG